MNGDLLVLLSTPATAPNMITNKRYHFVDFLHSILNVIIWFLLTRTLLTWKGCCKWLHQSNWHKLGHFRQIGTYGHSIHGLQNTGGPESIFLAHFPHVLSIFLTPYLLETMLWLFELITKCFPELNRFSFSFFAFRFDFCTKVAEKKNYEEKQKPFGTLFSPPCLSVFDTE